MENVDKVSHIFPLDDISIEAFCFDIYTNRFTVMNPHKKI